MAEPTELELADLGPTNSNLDDEFGGQAQAIAGMNLPEGVVLVGKVERRVFANRQDKDPCKHGQAQARIQA